MFDDPLIVRAQKGYAQTPHYKLIAFAIVAGLSSHFYGQIFTEGPYQAWIDAHGIASSDTGTGDFLYLEIYAENGALRYSSQNESFIDTFLLLTLRCFRNT